MRLERARAALVVVDVQEGFRKAIPEFDRIAAAAGTLVAAAAELAIPIVITEQYPRGLGATVPEVAARLPEETVPFEKRRFSALEAEGLDLGGREQALLCGIEAHVCVAQTALGLLAAEVATHVVADATGSRSETDRELGLRRIEAAGAVPTSVETALFELLGGADAAEFKAVQGLVK